MGQQQELICHGRQLAGRLLRLPTAAPLRVALCRLNLSTFVGFCFVCDSGGALAEALALLRPAYGLQC